ncbi:hypothetical protein Goshw_015819 [Gossypium schwendimanii]|uniref:Uncharacterized protein n=1 Tax=Gossypium schwendimanii TaxID=34291 RepID=A0A7J9M4C9_GOSSC|nr:hypothetical protein [Gossypium schwendimanii]
MSLNAPFSWEFKPEVSKLTCEEGNIGVRCAMLDLLHPPHLSKSSQFCVDDFQGVLQPPLAQSRGKVPFSWENKPGIRKETCQEGMEHHYFMRKLTPPPFPPPSVGMSIDGIKISPPPPPPSRRLKKSDDPFLAAYKECTRSTSKGKLAKRDSVSSLKKGIFNFSCKQSCSVENDNLVRVSQLPHERDR